MNPYIYIIASIIILIIILLAYQQSDNIVIPPKKQIVSHTNPSITSIFKEKDHSQDRIRCLPQKQIILYEDVGHIYNKGFIDETIFKPKSEQSSLKFESMLIKNDVPLNDYNNCSPPKALPIANINVKYLLDNNKISL